jgi:Holliday junction resolvase
MAMRHKPIKPKKHQAQQRKVRDPHTVYLNAEQQAALTKFQQDFRAAAPMMVETANVAQRIFQEVLDAPQWKIADTDRPNDAPKQQMWTVGHAKVNYVDHIDRADDRGSK